MKKILPTIFFAFLLFPVINYSQELIFKGIIKNTDGKILENVILSKKYKTKQAEVSPLSSDKFSIKLSDTLTLESISFSYLGYESFLVDIKQILLFIHNNKNADFMVVLKQKNTNLNQVVVTDKLPFYQNE